MFLVFANGVGADDDEVRTGNAMILDPYGEILTETNVADDAMVIADLDASVLPTSSGRRWLQARRPNSIRRSPSPSAPNATLARCGSRGEAAGRNRLYKEVNKNSVQPIGSMIRFLHVADFHLGLRITRFDEDACGRMAEARFTALRKVRTEAARLNVDFILVAGDVFDDHTVSKSDATRAFPILESSADACPVYIIPGNHDPLVPGGVWDRDPWLREQPHLRVHFLRNAEPVEVPSRPVTIFPCPLETAPVDGRSHRVDRPASS